MRVRCFTEGEYVEDKPPARAVERALVTSAALAACRKRGVDDSSQKRAFLVMLTGRVLLHNGEFLLRAQTLNRFARLSNTSD